VTRIKKMLPHQESSFPEAAVFFISCGGNTFDFLWRQHF